MRKTRFLFFIHSGHEYGMENTPHGLINSARFLITELFNKLSVESHIMEIDGVSDKMEVIDERLRFSRPSHAMIEALWLSPNEIYRLSQSHPLVHWVVRLHSDIPFLATESTAFSWINGYNNLKSRNVKIVLASNDERLTKQLNDTCGNGSVQYMPNIYNP